MDCRLLTGDHLDLSDYRFGTPQQSGCLTVVPITTPHATDLLRFPFDAGKADPGFSAGTLPPKHDSEQACLLAPLHFNAPVEQGRRAMMSRVKLVSPLRRQDLTGDVVLRASARSCPAIYSLPLVWRDAFWRRRPSAAGDALQVALLRQGFGLFPRVLRHPELRRWTSRIELLTGQTGALFCIDDRPVGLEIAPSPAYFAAIWQPLLLGCYGLTALLHAYDSPPTASPEPFAVANLTELRTEMFRSRHQRQARWEAALADSGPAAITIEEAQRWGNYRVQSLTGAAFAGQYVEEVTVAEASAEGAMPRMLRNLLRKGAATAAETTRKRIVYVSLFALQPGEA